MPITYITGAGGLVGREMDKILGQWNVPHYSVTRRPLECIGQNIISSDLCEIETWFDASHSDANIIHLAGMSNPRQENDDSDAFHKEVTIPYCKMIDRLLETGWSGRFVFASSGGTVYGEPKQLPISETHDLEPLTLYGEHKVLIERHLLDRYKDNPERLFILRISNIYGSAFRKATQGAVEIVADHILSEKTFNVYGDGSSVRDWIHIDDVTRAMLTCLSTPENSGSIYNIGKGEGIELNQIIAELETYFQRSLKKNYVPEGKNIRVNFLDCEKAHRLLGWAAKREVLNDIKNGLFDKFKT